MNFYKIMFLTCLICFQHNKHFASSKYKDSVLPVCYLRFKGALPTRSNPGRTHIKNFIDKQMKEKELLDRKVFYYDQNEDYHLVNVGLGTAFYIGDGRFVTSFHLIVPAEEEDESHAHLIIKYKDNIIHIDKNIQHDSISDLLVLHSTNKDIQDLLPLKIDIPDMGTYGDVISAFDYKENATIDIPVPRASFFLTKDQYDQLFIPRVNIKKGMSGSPLLYKDQVIGILSSVVSSHVEVACCTSSLSLLNLLKTPKITCNIEKCSRDGIDHLIHEAQHGNRYARDNLKRFLYDNKYVQNRFFP